MHALWSVATEGGSVLSVILTERRIQHMSVVVDVLADIWRLHRPRETICINGWTVSLIVTVWKITDWWSDSVKNNGLIKWQCEKRKKKKKKMIDSETVWKKGTDSVTVWKKGWFSDSVKKAPIQWQCEKWLTQWQCEKCTGSVTVWKWYWFSDSVKQRLIQWQCEKGTDCDSVKKALIQWQCDKRTDSVTVWKRH